MASESTKKTTAKASVAGGKKKTTEAKRSTVATKDTTKKGSTVKKTRTTKKSGAKTTAAKKESAKKVVASKSTAKVKASTSEKKEAVTKKVVRKENIKPIKEEKVVTKTGELPKNIEHEHFLIYTFLLSTVLICLHVMSRFTFHIDSVTIDYSVVLFSTVYFIANIITKKFDFKETVLSILISTITLLVFICILKGFNIKILDSYIISGQVFAYLISQFLNLIIYYYLLVNTELKARWIYINYLFALTAYYFISVLFSMRIVMTDVFWPTIFCSVILSGILAVMYAFYDIFIERGHE